MARTGLARTPYSSAVSPLHALADNLTNLVPDDHAPASMCEKMHGVGVTKASRDLPRAAVLGLLAGFFIGLGAVFYTLVTADTGLGFGMTKLVGGLVFCLGLILVVIAGAELFTGNVLMLAPCMSARLSVPQLLRSWGIVYFANLVGSLLLVGLLFLTDWWTLDGYRVGAHALLIADAKVNLAFVPALARGILCNALVCLAVWLCFSARTVPGKVVAILFPITAFVACGFEHSVANMFFIPMGIAMAGQEQVLQAAGVSLPQIAHLTPLGFVHNLVPVTIGNIMGGSLIAGAYWFVFSRQKSAQAQPSVAWNARPDGDLVAVLARARDDGEFLSQLAENPQRALGSYRLTDQERAALAGGDLEWLESRLGTLDEPLRTWIQSRLAQEKW
ncbi:MAG: formate/nitrite transporter family protein [Chloroflexota bacterium]